MTDETRPVRHVYQIYVYAVCLVTVLILLFSAVSAAYGFVRIAAPKTTAHSQIGPLSSISSLTDVFSGGADKDTERDHGVVQTIQSLIIAGAAGLVFYLHFRWAGKLRDEEESERAQTAAPKRKPRST